MKETSLCVSPPASTGEAEEGREGETLLGLCQTVVEGIPGHPPVTPVQNGEDICTGLSWSQQRKIIQTCACPPQWSCLTTLESVSAGRERRQQTGVFVRACPPGRPVAGEPSTRGALRQPAGAPEGPSGGRRKHTGAVVHAAGFPVQTEGRDQSWWLICLSEELLHSRPGSSTLTTAQILMVPNSARKWNSINLRIYPHQILKNTRCNEISKKQYSKYVQISFSLICSFLYKLLN